MSRVCLEVRRANQRGFTLVELMVALSGGLLLAVFVFMLASEGSKFYRREARVANATIGVMDGFQRMRADIARAAFLSSPNIVDDPFVCAPPAGYAGDGLTALANLAGVTLSIGGSYDAASDTVKSFWDGGGLTPDAILLAGSFASVDEFPAAEVVQTGSDAEAVWRIFLQPNSGSMARLGYRTTGSQSDAERTALVSTVFQPGRVVRIVDKKGWHHYGVIDSVGIDQSGTDRAPFIELTDDVALVQDSVNSKCGLQGLNRGAVVNVVNFVQYRLARLDTDSDYDPIYSDAAPNSFEDRRTELVRTEMQPDGVTPFDGTTELVTEYAVDLKFGLTALTQTLPRALNRIDEGDDALDAFTGVLSGGNNPHLIRTVHARLAVRSREGDRGGDVPSDVAPSRNIGMYRVPLANGAAPYARVRTLQADIALRNNYGAQW